MSTSLAPEEGQYSIICGCPLLSHWHGTSHFSFLFLSWWFWIPLWSLFYLLFSFLLHSHGYFKPFEQSPVMRTYLYIQIFQNLKFVFQDLRPTTQQKQNFLRAPINSNTSLANIVQGLMILLSVGELFRLETCLKKGGDIPFCYTVWFKWNQEPNSRKSKPELPTQEERRSVLSNGSEISVTGIVSQSGITNLKFIGSQTKGANL